MSDSWGFETKQVHVGGEPDPTTGARAVPIYQTTSYQFRDTDHAANLFGLAEIGNIYTRIMNPTQAALEARVNALEGGCTTAVGLPGTLAVASGQAAETLAFMTLCESGDHVVASPSLYGGTYNLLHYTLPKFGVEVTFVDDPDDLSQWEAAIKPNTKVLYGEVIPNPKNDVLDIEGIAGVAHENGMPLMVDNTVPTPYLIRPLEWGADIVIHSLTKFMGGHGTSVAGAIVDGGTFDYAASGRFPNFTEPDPSYHGLAYFPALGHGAFILKARVADAARHGAGDLAVQRVPHPAGPRDAEPADGAALRERPEGRRVPRRTRPGRVGQLRGSAVEPVARAGHPARRRPRLRLGARVRDRGRPRGRQEVRRGRRAAQPRRQHRRRAQPGDPPGDAPPTAS